MSVSASTQSDANKGAFPEDGAENKSELATEGSVKVLPGFAYEVLAEKEIPEPLDCEFSPDGLFWVTSRQGGIWVFDLARGEKNQSVHLKVDWSNDRGLHGIEFHPGYLTNSLVYLYFSPAQQSSPRNRVSRFKINREGSFPQIVAESEEVLLEFPSEHVGQHQGGAVEYNPKDNCLYVSTGDNNNIPDLEKYFDDPNNKAQNLNDLRGKVLRLNLDGSIPQTNPYYNQPGKRGEIYTRGHRQPFSIRVDEVTGRVFIGENGGDRLEDFEEINLAQPGGNYGWPRAIGNNVGTFGGNDPIPGAVKPWLTYQRHTGGSCTAGPFYRSNPGKFAFPSQYHHGLFYADYARKWLRFAKVNEQDGTVIKTEPFARGFPGGILSLEKGPDGGLYMVEYGGLIGGGQKDRVTRIIFKGDVSK